MVLVTRASQYTPFVSWGGGRSSGPTLGPYLQISPSYVPRHFLADWLAGWMDVAVGFVREGAATAHEAAVPAPPAAQLTAPLPPAAATAQLLVAVAIRRHPTQWLCDMEDVRWMQ